MKPVEIAEIFFGRNCRFSSLASRQIREQSQHGLHGNRRLQTGKEFHVLSADHGRTESLPKPLGKEVHEAADARRNLAASMNIGAFKLGNALGAAIGGGVIALDLGYSAVALAGAATSATGLAAVLLSRGRTAQVPSLETTQPVVLPNCRLTRSKSRSS